MMRNLLAVVLFAAVVLFVWQDSALAQDPGDDSEIYHGPEEKRAAGLETAIGEFLTIGGLVEVEGSYVKGEDDEESDIVLATGELGLGVELSENVSGEIVFLFEEDDTDLEIDVGAVTVAPSEIPLSLTAGRMYPPFGNYYSHFITDPLTLELGEIRETAAMVSYDYDFFGVSATVYNGDVDEVGEDNHVNGFVVAFSVSPMENIEFGGSYITNIADTDGLQDEFANGATDMVAGWGFYILAQFAPVSVIAEYLSAADPLQPAMGIAADGVTQVPAAMAGDQPSAWNFEISWDVNELLEIAGRYAQSDEFLDFPETSYGVDASYGIFENTTVSLEWLRNEYPEDEEENVITAHLESP